jgi:hypothetical protein
MRKMDSIPVSSVAVLVVGDDDKDDDDEGWGDKDELLNAEDDTLRALDDMSLKNSVASSTVASCGTFPTHITQFEPPEGALG